MFSLKNFIEISRQLYRNRVVARKKADANKKLLYFSDKEAEKLETDGLFIVKNYFTKEKCREIIKEIDNIWSGLNTEKLSAIREACLDKQNNKWGLEQSGGYKLWLDKVYSDHRIIGAEKISPLIMDLYQDEKCINIGEYHLGMNLSLQFTMANKIVFKKENAGSGGGWHRDNIYSKGFKCLVYLTDVSSDDGPFQYLPGSHKIYNHLFVVNSPGHYQFDVKEIDEMTKNNPKNIKEVTGEAGSLVLFDTNIIHRGKPISEGHARYALTNYYHAG